MEAALDKARDIPVDVRVTGDSGGRFKAAFTRPFTTNGFRTGNRNSRYVLVVSVTLETVPRHQYYSTRYVVDAVLRDTQSGAELFTYNAADREAHPASQADVDNRALIGDLRAIEEVLYIAGIQEVNKMNGLGQNFDELMTEQGLYDNSKELATKKLIAFELKHEMDAQKLSKSSVAKKMRTSRVAIDNILDPNHNTSIGTLERFASVLGKRLYISIQ